MRICDANVILRYILSDVPHLSSKAVDIIENNRLFIPFEVIAEVVYVLEKVYAVDRKDIRETLTDFIASPQIETFNQPILEFALDIYSDSRLDFVDTLLCGYRHVGHADISTFDRKLKNRLDAMESNLQK